MGGHTLSGESGIFFHQKELAPELPSLEDVSAWLELILRQESREIGAIYYVFVNDASLLEINQKYLQHDTLTDIITFPYQSDPVEAEIYISAERVRANAETYGVPIREEFLRVISHGVLHLCGWDDHSARNAQLMGRRENACLALFGIIPNGYFVSLSSGDFSSTAS